MLRVKVVVYKTYHEFNKNAAPYRVYVMDYDDDKQRHVLALQCRNVFDGGGVLVTTPVRRD